MNQPLKSLLVSLSLFALPCVAQRSLSGSTMVPQRAHAPVVQVHPKALLQASNGTTPANFGLTSAINRGGDTIVVGAPLEHTGNGGVYVFLKPASGWGSATETTQLAVPGLSRSQLGFAVAISADGNTIVASTGGGTVYVFSPAGGSWSNGGTVLAALTSSDVGSGVGDSLAISSDGQTIVAGGVSADSTEGAVYVYSKPSTGWANMTQTAKLTVAVPHSNQSLGFSVAIDANTIAAGAKDYNGLSGGPGEIFVFSKPTSGWTDGTQTAELLASDGAAGDALGYSVGISGNTVVAGALNHVVGGNFYAGALYVFVEPASGWADAFQTAELTASNETQNAGLGQSIAISGNLIAAGAPGEGLVTATSYGEACVFIKPGSGWANGTEAYDLIASTTNSAELGGSVALTSTGPVVISGAAAYQGKGAVFVFQK